MRERSLFANNKRKAELEDLQTDLTAIFNPKDRKHIQFIDQHLESFSRSVKDIHRNDFMIATPDLIVGLIWAAGYCPWWLALVIVVASTVAAYIMLERDASSNKQQFELHKLLILYDWCSKKGTLNLHEPIVQELIKTITPYLRYPQDHHLPEKRQQLSAYPMVQFFSDINQARHLNSYGYQPEKVKRALEGPVSESEESAAGGKRLSVDPGYVGAIVDTASYYMGLKRN